MDVKYWENNQTEISNLLDNGQRELHIAFDAKGPLKDLPSLFRIPDDIIRKHNENSASQFFLNVDNDKDPVEWVIDIGEQPL